MSGESTVEDIYPLSPMQQGMLFHSLYAPESGIYLLQVSFVFAGLDPGAFERALGRVTARHAVLRTSFAWKGLDRPVQVVHREVPLRIRNEDWSGLEAAEGRRRLEEYLALDAVQGFDLEEAPLTRFLLAHESGERFQVVWTIHHLLVDGWSTARIIGELFACYDALRQGKAEPLLDSPQRYRDYIAWLARQDPRRAESFWRQELAGFHEATPLPERSYPARESGVSQSQEFLGIEAKEALQAFAQAHRLTLNSVVQGAWALLLSHLSGGSDVLFGVTVSGRPPELAGSESIVGLFINTLPLRARTSGAELIAGWLRRLQDRHSEARQFGHVPLVEIQGWSELPRGAALFESLVVFENYPVASAVSDQGGGFAIEDLRFREANNFSLTLVATPGRRLSLALSWDRSRFDAAFACRLLGYLGNLLAEMVRRPEGRPDSLPFLPAGERHQLLSEWNGEVAAEPGACLHRLFAAQAARRPDAVAVTGDRENLSYGELNRRANRLAHRLLALGVVPDTPVALCVERSPEMVVSILAVLKAGGAYVPLDPAHPAERQRLVLNDCRAPLLIAHRHLAAQLPAYEGRQIHIDSALEEWEGQAAADPEIGVDPRNLAYVIYTSGSTGKPKGALVSHHQVSRLFFATAAGFGFGEEDVWSLFHSYAFDFSVWEIWGALLYGGRLAIVPWLVSRAPENFHQLLVRERVTVLNQTPTAFRQLVVADEAARSEAATRLVIFGGEALKPASLSSWMSRHGDDRPRLVNMYGITETTVHVTYRRVTAADTGREEWDGASPIGTPIPDLRVHLLDADLRPVAIGVPGELCVAGAGLARGYLGRPDLTAQRFIPDPFSTRPGERLYRSGDLGRRRPEGDLEYLGRIDHQVKIRGHRIELGEIESCLSAFPGVREAAVLALGTGDDRKLVAYLAPEDLPPAELRGFLRARLPEPMVPASWVMLSTLPLSANGKVDRRALARLEAATPARGETEIAAPPLGRMEHTVAAVWREVLGIEQAGRDESFFDLGGHSLLLIRVQSRLGEELGREVPLVELFRHPTIRTLAAFLTPEVQAPASRPRRTALRSEDRRIAIVGMSGRFPGASDVEAYWRNLRLGIESISFHSEEQLDAAWVDPEARTSPRFVAADGVLEGIELFDAGFFGYTPRDAEIADPQHRLFLECAWEALESAGYVPEGCPGPVGVFGGTSRSEYVWNLLSDREILQSVGVNRIGLATDKDYLATTVSYKLNLKGPSFSIQTACSTSLVAVHVASLSLLAGECDLALAGGASISVPQQTGYVYQEGGIRSPDGHCRAFDAEAQGLVAGNGVGVVALKRLADALADGDPIHAVILGSAVNNDGAAKVGYAAPGVDGQAEVIRTALESGEVDPRTVGYVEAHGTGTPLGDPIEIAALTQAFHDAGAREPGFCGVGSAKTNIGHLDAAAGVAGLIKAALVVEHGVIPPSLHFANPNPAIDFATGPFRVVDRLRDWPTAGGPRRAGVSSFGIGGTNAHAILEQPPAIEPGSPSRHSRQLVVLSARSPAALDAATTALSRHLEGNPETDLADVAWTLQTGRRAFSHRRAVLCRNSSEARAALAAPGGERVEEDREVVFLFPGQGAQRPGMGLGLDLIEPHFRADFDRADEILRPLLGCGLRDLLAGDRFDPDDTARVQPALFAIEYALAHLWMSWGVRPAAMIGHSLGEYVAACLAGVFSFEEGLALVTERGRLLGALPRGSMASLPLSEEETLSLLTGSLSLAAVNSPAQCVVSGPEEEVRELLERLAASGAEGRRLRTSHAFHSAMVEPAMAPFAAFAGRLALAPPRIPWISNLTGTWITAAEAVDPEYWARHLRGTVRFAAGLDTVLRSAERRTAPALLEIGPGRALSALAQRHPDRVPTQPAVASLHSSGDRQDESETLLAAVGRLWSSGVPIDWRALRGDERRRRLALPTYPFERRRYWIDRKRENAPSTPPPPARRELADWFRAPYWKPAPPLRGGADASGPWLVVLGEQDPGGGQLGETLLDHLRHLGAEPLVFRPGNRPSREDFASWLAEVARTRGALPTRVLHLGGAATAPPPARGLAERLDRLERETDRGFYSLLHLLQALGDRESAERFTVTVVTVCAQRVGAAELPCPERAMMMALCRVAPLERPGLSCRAIDIGSQAPGPWLAKIAAEIAAPSAEPLTAWRGGERWLPDLEPLRLTERAPIREEGIWLVTGGLGGIGLQVAEHLAASRARLVLVGRTGLPPEEEWTREPARERPAGSAFASLLARRETELRRELKVRGIAGRPGAQEALDAFAAARLLRFLIDSGVEIRRDARHRRDDLRAALGLKPAFYRFLDFILEVLAEDSWVRMEGDTAVVLNDASNAPDPAALALAATERHPALRSIFKRLERCVASYQATLAGEGEALGDLVSGGSNDPEENLFDVEVYTRLAAEVATHAADQAAEAGRGLRVLEIGGGHGNLTRAVAPALAGRGAEYWFTDLGRLFVTEAERAARQEGFDFLRFGQLDASRDAVEQGYEAESFDLIFALNVVHATPDVEACLSNLRRLLRPGGSLCLIELTRRQRWGDMIWGLTEGWWHFSDSFRRGSPLLDLDSWRRVLAQSGFEAGLYLPEDESGRAVSDCSLLLATRPSAATAAGDGGKSARIRRMRAIGAEVVVERADVADTAALSAVARRTKERFGRIDGVIHAAGVPGGGLIELRTRESLEAELSAKVRGTLALGEVCREHAPDHFVLFSSTSAFTGQIGQAGYCAANAYLDAWAHLHAAETGASVLTIDWDRWQGTGMAVAVERRHRELTGHDSAGGMTPEEGIEAFARALAGGRAQLVVSPEDFAARAVHERKPAPPATIEAEAAGRRIAPASLHERPDLTTAYVPPSDELETEIAAIWQEVFGMERIGIHDDFFDLGGDSLVALQLVSRLGKAVGLELRVRSLFDAPTIAALAILIEEAMLAGASDEELALAGGREEAP